MAKISSQAQSLYLEKTKKYRAFIEACLEREQETLHAIEQYPNDSTFKRLSLVEEMLNLSSYYLIENGISLSVLQIKDKEALDEGRKSVYKSVTYLEQIITGLVDAPYSEYGEKVEQIAFLNAQQRYLLIRKMGLAITLMEQAYKEKAKWKWVFVELEGRYAALVKNIIDLKNAVANTDPRSPNYAPTVYHLRLMKKSLAQAAYRYRERYELSTTLASDFETGIRFLMALRRIHILLGENEDAAAVKRKIDTWEAKLKSDKQRDPVLLPPLPSDMPLQ
jgi:phage gp36-like protein